MHAESGPSRYAEGHWPDHTAGCAPCIVNVHWALIVSLQQCGRCGIVGHRVYPTAVSGECQQPNHIQRNLINKHDLETPESLLKGMSTNLIMINSTQFDTMASPLVACRPECCCVGKANMLVLLDALQLPGCSIAIQQQHLIQAGLHCQRLLDDQLQLGDC